MRRKKQVPYEDLSDYTNSLTYCDQICPRSHDFTRWKAAQSRRDQDFMHDCLAEWIPSEPGILPSLTCHFCEGIIGVVMRRHLCTSAEALVRLPEAIRALCLENGFS